MSTKHIRTAADLVRFGASRKVERGLRLGQNNVGKGGRQCLRGGKFGDGSDEVPLLAMLSAVGALRRPSARLVSPMGPLCLRPWGHLAQNRRFQKHG